MQKLFTEYKIRRVLYVRFNIFHFKIRDSTKFLVLAVGKMFVLSVYQHKLLRRFAIRALEYFSFYPVSLTIYTSIWKPDWVERYTQKYFTFVLHSRSRSGNNINTSSALKIKATGHCIKRYTISATFIIVQTASSWSHQFVKSIDALNASSVYL